MVIPSLILVLIFFIIPRLPWFFSYPVAILNPDSFGYLTNAYNILTAQMPDFTVRFPVYPLFLSAVIQATSSIKIAIILQNIFILLCACVFLWAVARAYPRMILLGALVIGLQIGQPNLVAHGFTILTETIFSGFVILFSAWLIMAIGKNKPGYFVWAFVAAGFAYLTHPRGIFLFFLYPFVVLYLLSNRLPRLHALYAAIPLMISLLIIPAYRLIASQYIIHTPEDYLDHYHTYCLTSPFWETDEAYPQKVNDMIVQFKQKIPPQDIKTMNESWNADELYDVFTHAYQEINQWGDPQSINLYFNGDLDLTRRQRDELGQQIAYQAISTHHDIFIKFIWASFRKSLSGWVWSPLGVFYEYYPKYLDESYLPDGSLSNKTLVWAFRDYSQLPAMPALPVIMEKGREHYGFIPSTSYRINVQFSQALGLIFSHNAWFYAFVGLWTASLIVTIVTGLRHRGAFLLFSFGFLLIVIALLIPLSLTSYANSRYSIPTHYFQYVVVLFSPLLFAKQRDELD